MLPAGRFRFPVSPRCRTGESCSVVNSLHYFFLLRYVGGLVSWFGGFRRVCLGWGLFWGSWSFFFGGLFLWSFFFEDEFCWILAEKWPEKISSSTNLILKTHLKLGIVYLLPGNWGNTVQIVLIKADGAITPSQFCSEMSNFLIVLSI